MQNLEKVQVSVGSFKTIFTGEKDVVYFQIDMQSGGQKWLVQKRFSDLKMLEDNLKKNHSNLPNFPKKSFFTLKKYEDLDERRRQLDLFLKTIFLREDMYKDLQFLTFFQIKEKLNIQYQEYLKLNWQIDNQCLGFRDFQYNFDKKIFLVLLSDMSAISRVDSYVTNNLKLPWEKNDEDSLYFSVGLLEFYKINPNSKIKFQRLFNISFPTQAICCEYNEILDIIVIGCDCGTLYIFQLDNNSTTHYTEIFKEKIHGGRIMGVQVDGVKNLVYSVGEDGIYQTVNVQARSLIGSILISNKSYFWQVMQSNIYQ